MNFKDLIHSCGLLILSSLSVLSWRFMIIKMPPAHSVLWDTRWQGMGHFTHKGRRTRTATVTASSAAVSSPVTGGTGGARSVWPLSNKWGVHTDHVSCVSPAGGCPQAAPCRSVLSLGQAPELTQSSAICVWKGMGSHEPAGWVLGVWARVYASPACAFSHCVSLWLWS